MYRIGASSSGAPLDEAKMADYAANGITDMEISEHYYTDYDYRGVRALADRFSVNLWSLHLPFWGGLDISSPDSSKREPSLETHFDIIRRASDIGIDKFVIHPSSEPVPDDRRSEHMKCAQQSLARLAELAERCGAIICAEDLPRSCISNSIANMQLLLSADERLKACVDTNHITAEPPQQLIRALGGKIATLHVSDFDFINERHWLPGEGKIDWPEVLRALDEVGYNGVWMYELGFECPKTIYRDRDLTCADLSRNAHELFAGERPTVISRPKPNLGMWE